MNRLIFNQEVIRTKTGLDTKRALLVTQLDLESRAAASPFMLEKHDGSCVLLLRDIENGNFCSEGSPASAKYYQQYLTFDPARETLKSNWLDLLQENMDGKELEVDACIYYAAFKTLAERFAVRVAPSPSWHKVYLHEVNSADVSRQREESYEQCRADVGRVAPKLADCVEDFKDERFRMLDEMLGELKLDALLVSSPLNQQEISGPPLDLFASFETVTFYYKKRVYVLASQPIFHPLTQLTGVFADLKSAVNSLADTGTLSIGIEENHLPYGLLRESGLQEKRIRPVSVELRKWREDSAGEELPYYIIAAQASRHSIDSTLKHVDEVLKKSGSLLETDVEKQLYVAYQEFVKKWDLSVKVRPYQTVLHTGERSRKPSPPKLSQVNSSTITLKIDAGLVVIDKNGLVRGVSDVGRTLVRDENGLEMYNFMEEQMLDVAIPAVKAGRTGEDVYMIGTKELLARQKRWVELKLLPAEIDLPTSYNRDIGHVMGKQEPVNLTFRQGNKGVLKIGMVGCVEYHWPYYPYGIAIEDMFALTPQGVVNITR